MTRIDAQYQAEKYLKAKVISENPLSLRVVMANEPTDDDKSFLSFAINWTGSLSPTLSGSTVIHEGQIQMALVYEVGRGSNQGLIDGGKLSALFPYPSKWWITPDLRIDTQKPVDVLNGFRVGSEWRVPVVLDFRLFS